MKYFIVARRHWQSIVLGQIAVVISCLAAAAPITATPELPLERKFAGTPLDKQLLQRVNSRINKIPYIPDTKNYDQIDHWASPETFYARGGDCEDYALAKMYTLLGYGLPADDMELLVVRKRTTGELHTLLAVHLRGTWILDNERNELKGVEYLDHFEPIYHTGIAPHNVRLFSESNIQP